MQALHDPLEETHLARSFAAAAAAAAEASVAQHALGQFVHGPDEPTAVGQRVCWAA